MGFADDFGQFTPSLGKWCAGSELVRNARIKLDIGRIAIQAAHRVADRDAKSDRGAGREMPALAPLDVIATKAA
jgi:hypothetical protein